MEKNEKGRLEKLQALADVILEKLRLRMEGETPEQLNPQALKHITGVMKDIRDIQLTRTESDNGGVLVQVLWEGELEQYSV